MDQLQQKHFDTSRGYRYQYYISPASLADSSKPALLVCHGWPDSALLWKDVVPYLLQSKNRLILPDLLGYGGTSKPTDPKEFEISAMVNDVMEIVKEEGVDKQGIIAMGHDWGSYFAQRFYLLNTPQMRGLITLNVALMPARAEPFNLQAVNEMTTKAFGYPSYAYWDLFADPSGPALMTAAPLSVWHAMHGADANWMRTLFCTTGAMRDWVSAGRTDVPLKPYAENPELKNHWISWVQTNGLTSAGCWYRAMAENIQLPTEKLILETNGGKVDTPYLFIGCDGDAVCRTDAIEGVKKAGLVQEKDLEVVELQSGHWCPFERPKEVGEAVLGWLRRRGFAGV